MLTMTTRPAQAGDLSTLAEYWYDRMALIQQLRPMALSASAQSLWQTQAQAWLHAQMPFWVVMWQTDLLGGACALLDDATQSARLCVWALDLHVPHKQQGAGKYLWQALRADLQQRGVHQLWLTEAPLLAVEQAFWQSMGIRSMDKQWYLEW